jgi:hypothetical protein
MKSFLIWLIVCVLILGGLSLVTHRQMSAYPTRIVVAFDESYYMKDAWPRIASRLKPYTGRRYTEYFVISNKNRISGDWEKELSLDRFHQTRLFLDEFPVEDLINSRKYPELKQADRIIVLTASKDTAALKANSKVELIQL